jgi:hypothetical protein
VLHIGGSQRAEEGIEVSNQGHPSSNQEDWDRNKALEIAYTRVGQSYEAITEFRAKLLALLPLATGTGTFLLLERSQGRNGQLRMFLGPIGIFGVVVTAGLFAYELRGMQRCHRLEVQAEALEREFKLRRELAPFWGQPPRTLGNMLGPPAAGLIIYSATAFAWFWLAGYGFRWPTSLAWASFAYPVLLFLAWIWLSCWLQQAANGATTKVCKGWFLCKKWKKHKVEMPPICGEPGGGSG